MKEKVLVIGATGNIGAAAAKALLGEGYPVRVLVRDEKKAGHMLGDSVEVITGDASSFEDVKKAVEGAGYLFVVLPTFPGCDVQFKNIADAVKGSGVKRIVKVSVMGAAKDSPIQIARWHAESDELFAATGISYTFLHPGMFMTNLLAEVPGIKASGAINSPFVTTKLAMIDPRDIGETGAKILVEGGFDGQTVPMTGNEEKTYGDVAALLTKKSGKEIKGNYITPDEAFGFMTGAGVPEWYANDLRTMMNFFGNSDVIKVNTVEGILGREPRTLENWINDNLAAFN